MSRALLVALAAMTSWGALAGPAGAAPQGASSTCTLSAHDRAWIDRSVSAWVYTARSLISARLPARFDANIFDAQCLLRSRTALLGGAPGWVSAVHGAKIRLPNGNQIPAGVTSFAWSDGHAGFFVMSTPSVWRAGKVPGGPLGLDMLMTAVLLHEASHVTQMQTYGKRMETLSKRYDLPESFGDDSIQERFQASREFASSVQRETALFLQAAAASDRKAAIRFAAQARELMRQRQQRWYPARDSYLAEAEDIWLTMEGSAQWAGYRWLMDARGGHVSPAAAAAGFGSRGKWWSQSEGFALFMALERLTAGRWKRHAFNDGAATGLEMLDRQLVTSRPELARGT